MSSQWSLLSPDLVRRIIEYSGQVDDAISLNLVCRNYRAAFAHPGAFRSLCQAFGWPTLGRNFFCQKYQVMKNYQEGEVNGVKVVIPGGGVVVLHTPSPKNFFCWETGRWEARDQDVLITGQTAPSSRFIVWKIRPDLLGTSPGSSFQPMRTFILSDSANIQTPAYNNFPLQFSTACFVCEDVVVCAADSRVLAGCLSSSHNLYDNNNNNNATETTTPSVVVRVKQLPGRCHSSTVTCLTAQKITKSKIAFVNENNSNNSHNNNNNNYKQLQSYQEESWLVASGSYDGTVNLWKISKSKNNEVEASQIGCLVCPAPEQSRFEETWKARIERLKIRLQQQKQEDEDEKEEKELEAKEDSSSQQEEKQQPQLSDRQLEKQKAIWCCCISEDGTLVAAGREKGDIVVFKVLDEEEQQSQQQQQQQQDRQQASKPPQQQQFPQQVTSLMLPTTFFSQTATEQQRLQQHRNATLFCVLSHKLTTTTQQDPVPLLSPMYLSFVRCNNNKRKGSNFAPNFSIPPNSATTKTTTSSSSSSLSTTSTLETILEALEEEEKQQEEDCDSLSSFTLFSSGYDCVVSEWSLLPSSSFRCLRLFRGHSSPIFGLGFWPNQTTTTTTSASQSSTTTSASASASSSSSSVPLILFSCSRDLSVRVWDIHNQQLLRTCAHSHFGRNAPIYSSSSSSFLSSIYIFHEPGKTKDKIQGYSADDYFSNQAKRMDSISSSSYHQHWTSEQALKCLTVLPNGCFVTGALDGGLCMWRFQRATPTNTKTSPKAISKKGENNNNHNSNNDEQHPNGSCAIC